VSRAGAGTRAAMCVYGMPVLVLGEGALGGLLALDPACATAVRTLAELGERPVAALFDRPMALGAALPMHTHEGHVHHPRVPVALVHTVQSTQTREPCQYQSVEGATHLQPAT
jgi:hypothetical protein